MLGDGPRSDDQKANPGYQFLGQRIQIAPGKVTHQYRQSGGHNQCRGRRDKHHERFQTAVTGEEQGRQLRLVPQLGEEYAA